MKFAKLALAAVAIAAAPMTAQAQDVGSTVYGNDGQPIGQVTSNDGTNAVVSVGEYEAALPVSIFGTSEQGPTINTTREAIEGQLAAAAEQQAAAAAEAQAAAEAEAAARLEAALVVGAEVVTADAMSLGLVDEITGGNVVVKTADEQLVTLPQNFFAVDADGTLLALANLADIMAAVQQAGG